MPHDNNPSQSLFILIPTREAIVGDNLPIHRALPSRHKRLIGAWCFLDHAGPTQLPADDAFFIGPHPHIGLQTFTWMIEGELYHQDSLGFKQLIKPYEINLMTAGDGISHIEMSPDMHSKNIHTAQLWIALPNTYRHMQPQFVHYSQLPTLTQSRCKITVLAGEFLDCKSPVQVYSELMGADIEALEHTQITLPLRADFEYGILLLQGSTHLQGENILPDTLIYLEPNQTQITLNLNANTRLLLIGGVAFEEDVIIWWNFVARSSNEIRQAAQDWIDQTNRFGVVEGFDDRRLSIPPVPDGLKSGHN